MRTDKDNNLSGLSHIKIGGKAEHLYFPESYEELGEIYLKSDINSPVIPLGGCSNILFGNTEKYTLVSDRYLPWKWILDDHQLVLSANHNINYVIKKLAAANLGGLEFLAGIPAHIGGLTYMNAGAYQKSISAFIEWVKVLDQDGERVLDKNDCQFAYRHSAIKGFITEVALNLIPESEEIILKKITDNINERRIKQPLNKPNLGCFFKNPPQHSAGIIIDQLGLKGYRVGGAMVSEKHANFIVNQDQATFQDMMTLIHMIQDKVRERFSIELDLEVKVIDE